MSEKKLFKLGYYDFYQTIRYNKPKIKVDSGSTIHIGRLNKTITNPYRDIKYFDTIEDAKKYVIVKLNKNKILKKQKMLLYLVLIKEISTNRTFVKVGITSKKFVHRRFDKKYGYDGYTIESVLRKIETNYAGKLEDEIKRELNKQKNIKRYRPILESFSGYSECYNLISLNDITKIFDEIVNKNKP